MKVESNDTPKIVAILVLSLVIFIQLEFLWHITGYLINGLLALKPLLYFLFCLLFLAAIYYLYRLNEAKKEAAQYTIHNYKRPDEFEQEKRRLTHE